MTKDIYKRLAEHLDRLPGSYPPTESGVELRILRRLFTPEQAELALHLTLIPESALVVAHRAGMETVQVQNMLDEMAAKGLISDRQHRDERKSYAAANFVVGIWEYQVNRLDAELVHDVDEYLSQMFDFEVWRDAPQIRTIPVNESLPAQGEVIPYENAEAMVRSYSTFAVANCICRQEKSLVGEGCGKPLESCLMMGGTAFNYVRHRRAREITMEEALQVLVRADEAGLVLQPGNSRDTSFICCCCGDCCGVLRNAKQHPQPAQVLSSSYYAVSDQEICSACGDCIARCQMDAIDTDDGYAVIDLARCIGCGLCVTTCSTGAMHLLRKADEEVPYVPKTVVEAYVRIGRRRGVMSNVGMAKMAVKSAADRVVAGRK